MLNVQDKGNVESGTSYGTAVIVSGQETGSATLSATIKGMGSATSKTTIVNTLKHDKTLIFSPIGSNTIVVFDVANLEAHDGTPMTVIGSDATVQGKNVGENVIVYVKNDSIGQILFSEIRVGGAVYTYIQTGIIPAFSVGTGGTYTVMDNSTSGIAAQAGLAQPGETIGILLDLADNFPTGRDTQFKLTTTNGAVFVGTVVMGQNTG